MSLFSNILPTFLNKAGEWVESTTGNVISATGSVFKKGVESLISKPYVPTEKEKQETIAKSPVKESLIKQEKYREDLKKSSTVSKSIVAPILQAPQRAITSVLLEPAAGIISLATGKKTEPVYKPKSVIEKTLLGEEEIKGIFKRQEEAQKKLEEAGVPKGVSGLLGAVGVAGMTSLDLTPFGGEKNTAKLVAKSKNLDEIFNLIKPILKDKTDDTIMVVAKELVNVSKPESVKDVLLKEVSRGEKLIGKDRGFVSSVRELYPESTNVAGQYIPRSTDALAVKAKNLIKDDIDLAERVAISGVGDESVATAAELVKHYGDEAMKSTDKATRNALFERQALIANDIAKNLTEHGRSVQAASILGRLTPEGQVRFAAREIQKYNEAIEKTKGGIGGLRKKIPELTGKQADEILTEMKAISEMEEGTEKAMRFKKLQDSIVDLVPSTLFDKVMSVWKAGLLTGIKTSGLNIMSNLSHAGTELAKDIPAVVVDKVASLFTKKRTINLTGGGLAVGAKEGFKKGWQYFKTGYSDRDLGIKLDYKRVNFGKGKIAKAIQRYEETVFRIIGAEDQPFFYGAKAHSIASQAKSVAKNLGLKGKELQTKIDELIENPTEEMLRYALLDAETAVFQNKTKLGELAKSIQKTKVGEFVVPFGRTPSSVATQVLNYSPIGIAKTIIQNIGKGRFDQRLFSQGIGRGITGTAVLAIGGGLMRKGLLSLSRPTTEREAKLWEIEGRKENSIKIGDKWRSVQVLGPAGSLLIVGGAFQDSLKKDGSITKAMTTALLSGGKSFLENTFLRGIDQIVNAITDPERYGEGYLSSTIASAIPTIVSDVARAIDPLERRAENIKERVISRIPGARQTLEPQVTVLGKEKERVGNIFEVLADPTRPYKETLTPVTIELRRLWDSGYKVSPTLLGDREGYKILTPEQNTELWKKAGSILESKLDSLFKKEEYNKLSDEKKAKLVDDFADKSKTLARTSAVLEVTEGLSGQELITKLKELKADGIMNETVFKEFQRLR